jgi:uncharacterized Zn finger protein
MSENYTCPDCGHTKFEIVREGALAETECIDCGSRVPITGLVPPGRKN